MLQPLRFAAGNTNTVIIPLDLQTDEELDDVAWVYRMREQVDEVLEQKRRQKRETRIMRQIGKAIELASERNIVIVAEKSAVNYPALSEILTRPNVRYVYSSTDQMPFSIILSAIRDLDGGSAWNASLMKIEPSTNRLE